jgi:hypothetical protein
MDKTRKVLHTDIMPLEDREARVVYVPIPAMHISKIDLEYMRLSLR